MNLPNKLTVLRVLMIPVFLVFLLLDAIPHNYLWALIVFILASLTDMLDGKIARKHGLVTDFGKFMDPLADKLLVNAALICFIEKGLVMAVLVFIIIAREFLVTSLRLIAAGKGTVIAADIWGKVKTVCQIIAVCLIMLLQELLYAGVLPQNFPVGAVNAVSMWIVVVFTVLSGFNYLWKNRSCIASAK
ncbi:CDP-diacylglycerol--glycerol-3-phosphate 3-phosphatidyltransferase [Zongyangia hominis]|uniref:CDP-diacylglycerol--glycerol-3-phosphate 3-phosphatidyltransferase n=1 Tax=Zongyangia hominis TaxID=2763677 RepID=A0A926EFH8_9FIRM|nr:CDP-diacylglycerol--glycerol-3-phosphate 3-phosphatidyltransferase [Zongyangia hominis]MBC8570896.1 CDP-diacylglycerol--glycerol-3-phosphate 3-phosphatidyltransferase [Zongyangia hominis]